MRPVPLWQFLLYLLGLIILAVLLAGSYHAASAAGKAPPHCRGRCGGNPSAGIRPVVKMGPAYRGEYRKPRPGKSSRAIIKIGDAYTAESDRRK